MSHSFDILPQWPCLSRSHAKMFLGLLVTCGMMTAMAQRQMEVIDRGLVAIPSEDGKVFLSWRFLHSDPGDTSFNLFRISVEGSLEKVNDDPIENATCFVDLLEGDSQTPTYFVRALSSENESNASLPVPIWKQSFLEIPIRSIPGYQIGDASVGDLDGDGAFEIVLHQTSKARDNSHAGITGKPILDAYKLDGTFLWRIDLGINIREGEHYTQFMVYDLDGDGKAELACKTADGTVDGQGKVIGDKDKDWRIHDASSQRFGRILEGPEYFTIFNGQTGAAMQTVDYIPTRDPIDGWGGKGGNGNNDSYGNRCDRFLACVAYLDGKRPSVVMCRGVYGRIVMVAWDWRDGNLIQRWVFDSKTSYPPFEDASPFSGMGGHSLSVGDVDQDGRDEIVYQGMTVDDNGKGLYSTGRRHGDSMHLSDFYPDRPGLEMFLITENEGHTVRFQTPGVGVHDARTGEVIWSHSPGIDVGSGMAADIDPRYPGYEAWGGPGGLRNHLGDEIAPAPRMSRWAIWWDGDLLRELVGRRDIYKWDWEKGEATSIEKLDSGRSLERPSLAGDIIGDWREEILTASPDGKSLRLYSTTIPTKHRLTTLIQDPQYRLALTWQNVVYNKPPHPSYFLGHGMKLPDVGVHD
jgi:rhamnogalacturonan endolyase